MISEVVEKNLLNSDKDNLEKAKNLYKDITDFKTHKAFYSEDKIFVVVCLRFECIAASIGITAFSS